MKRLGLTAVLFVALASVCHAAPIVDVTVTADKGALAEGETTTLRVWAEIKPEQFRAGDGLFSWDVDLLLDAPSVLQLLPDTLVRPGWDNDSSLSSGGTVMSWGLDAIYDSSFQGDGLGHGQPVELLNIQIKALSQGQATLSLRGDATYGADFVRVQDSTGRTAGMVGDYDQATMTFSVIPEPSSMSLLVLAGVAALRKRRG